VSESVGEISYRGAVHVRPWRRGTYLGADHLETLVEQALGLRYSYGGGWDGYAVVSIAFHDEPPPGTDTAEDG
jgi:hypothetical protein